MMDQKFKLAIPPDATDPKTFIRDLYMACCGHPGWAQGGEDAGDMDEESDEENLSEDDGDYDVEGVVATKPILSVETNRSLAFFRDQFDRKVGRYRNVAAIFGEFQAKDCLA